MQFIALSTTLDIQAQVGANPVFEIFGYPVNDTTLLGFGVSIFLVILAIFTTRKLEMIPSGIQNVMEMLIESIINLTEGMLEGGGKKLLPFIGTIALFIGVSNLIGILPLIKNPTADLNVTAAFGLSVFIFANFYGIAKKGLVPYIKSFFQPVFFLFPINVIGELAKPISHSFRLFGNIFGGGVIVALVSFFIPGIVPVPLMAWFDLFIGLVQALIFTMLAIAYVAMATE